MVRKAPTETNSYVSVKIDVDADDLVILQDWARSNFRTAGGQASFIIKELIERRRNGNGQAQPQK